VSEEGKSAQFNASLKEVNQHGLRPWLEPLLAAKKLVSVAINGTASVSTISKAPRQ